MKNTIEPVALRHIPLDVIDLDDTTYQFRFRSDSKPVRRSLANEGQLNPVSVLASENGYRLIDGFCRARAAESLGWTEIHAAIYPAMEHIEAKRLAFVMNVVRKNLTKSERANAMHLARQEGLSVEEVAKLFGVSPRTVRRYLEFPAKILQWIDGSRVTMAHGKVLASACVKPSGEVDDDSLTELVTEVRERGLSAKQLAVSAERNGTPARGRPRRYALVSRDEVRCYAFRLSANSSSAELLKAAGSLRDVVESLEDMARAARDNHE